MTSDPRNARLEQLVRTGAGMQTWLAAPHSRVARQEDIAFTAGRLLALAQALRRPNKVLAELIESALASLGSGSPMPAVEALDAASRPFASDAAYWALVCHTIGHSLAEFGGMLEPAVREHLRASLPECFATLRRQMAADQTRPSAEDALLWEAVLGLCAVFNDQGAFAESVAAALGRASAPGPGGAHVELLALLAGASRASTDSGTFLRVLGVLDQNAGDPHAAELLAVLRPDGKAERAGEQEAPAKESGERRRRRGDGIDRTPVRRRSRLGGLFDSTSTLFWPVVLVVFGLICLGCAGWFVQWVFETSPVGDQSLDQWYKTSKRPSPY